MRRWLSILLVIVLLLSCNCRTVIACDEKQTDECVTEILFGRNATKYANNDNVKMLTSALYLCCEQSGREGEDKLRYLKKKVFGLPSISAISVDSQSLPECSHNTWGQDVAKFKNKQTRRRDILQSTVNTVFDFGTYNKLFGRKKGKCNSFAALLYYSHILADYLVNDIPETNVFIKGNAVKDKNRRFYIEINNNEPSFTDKQLNGLESHYSYSQLDSHGRAGVAFAIIGPEDIKSSDTREYQGSIRPTAWKEGSIYDRSHLIGHQLGGSEIRINMITGTIYLNRSLMKAKENEIAKHVSDNKVHVLYRVTPVFEDNNYLASGVQMEAYSIEDGGKLHFNVYCYNISPGKVIDYTDGSFIEDTVYDDALVLPFARANANENNPDLLFEIDKHLELLFEDQKNTRTYINLKNKTTEIAKEARAISNTWDSKEISYYNPRTRELEKAYYEALCSYIPSLLKKEQFFNSVFGK